MRSIRVAALLLAFVALTPAAAKAQAGRPFTDSWFWGAKVGAFSFSTTRIENGIAPSVGADWLITRSRGALYISLDRAFFTEESTIPGATGNAVVDLKDLTRFGFALLAFPKPHADLNPYFGAGLTMSFIQRATMAPGGSAPAGSLEEGSSQASFQLLAGLQKQLGGMSIFGQVTMLPYAEEFLLNARDGFAFEAGVRWNVGNSIDKIR